MKPIQYFTAIVLLITCGCHSLDQKDLIYLGSDENNNAYYCSRCTDGYTYKLLDSTGKIKNESVELKYIEIHKGENIKNPFPIEQYVKSRFPYIYAFYTPPANNKGKEYREQYPNDWLLLITECSLEKFQDFLAGKKYESYADIFNSNTAICMAGDREAIKDASKDVKTLLTHFKNIAHHNKELAINTYQKLYGEAIEIQKIPSLLEFAIRKEEKALIFFRGNPFNFEEMDYFKLRRIKENSIPMSKII